ncbi:hypothetical protein BDY19DRAFT_886012 [Irpex rosettiformis]|uniref:Uncharacterized protein n=1 Tax=Irpex rosettiformis TaxID=378272 RepID=A0ACB8UAH4_9APHY|nr:hypothetical protein BDY19DRAFT_886012 [Irpex rosettiformis]
MRERARGRMCYSVPLIIFMDDVSGNISKQWNKHFVAYMSNGNLPREMIEKEFCVRFVTSSPHASPMELMQAIRDSISAAAESGVDAWDCMNDEEVLLLVYALFFTGDNPMQAELCSQLGLQGNFFCRTCYVGGTRDFKSSLEGYASLFKEGRSRHPSETAEEISKQVRTSIQPGAQSEIENIRRSSGVRDTGLDEVISTIVEMGKKLRGKLTQPPLSESDIKNRLREELQDLLQQREVKDCINPLLGLPGVDIHKDTPTEILHTVLLGVVKYFWAQTVALIEKAKSLSLLQARMQSLTTHGLNLPSFAPEYICHYRGGLIGKHFKSIAQVMPFIIYDLVPSNVLDAWNVIGDLVMLLWHTEIDDREKYLVSCLSLCGLEYYALD